MPASFPLIHPFSNLTKTKKEIKNLSIPYLRYIKLLFYYYFSFKIQKMQHNIVHLYIMCYLNLLEHYKHTIFITDYIYFTIQHTDKTIYHLRIGFKNSIITFCNNIIRLSLCFISYTTIRL